MDILFKILDRAIELKATDIHLSKDVVPVYRINRKLNFEYQMTTMTPEVLNEILEFFVKQDDNLEMEVKSNKQADFPYNYKNYRLRINVSFTNSVPIFAFRVIPNNTINPDELGITPILERMLTINSGLILITGKVNSGKTTTMNAYIQEINNRELKKIVTLEDPIEYVHKSNKSMIIQKEIGKNSDVNTYYDGLINLLREDFDIAVVGEIRDKKTMDVAIDLAESGGLVIGTLHTRSCGETIDRIVNMYDPADQQMVKSSLSSIVKLAVSQKLVTSKEDELVLVPEVMYVNQTIAALIRQERFSISEIEDTIHAQREYGCISYEQSFAQLFLNDVIDMQTIKNNIDHDRIDTIKNIIVNNSR